MRCFVIVRSTKCNSCKKQKIGFLLEVADRYWYSYFRNVLNAELDLRIENAIKSGTIPTGPQISIMHYTLLGEYYGDIIADTAHVYAHEWITNFVPFLNYAHHNWPASMTAAGALLQKAERGENVARAFFFDITKNGDSNRGYHVLLENGIDMATPEPYELTIQRFEQALGELEFALDDL